MRVNHTTQIDNRALPPTMRLLDLLRDQLLLTGTKESCGRGECGACTVLVDGEPVMSCITMACRVDGDVETVELLAAENPALCAAFARHAAFQCGFCTPGHIVHGTALLRRGLPDEERLRGELSGNICRCTGYAGILDALQEVARGDGEEPVPYASDAPPEGAGWMKEDRS